MGGRGLKGRGGRETTERSGGREGPEGHGSQRMAEAEEAWRKAEEEEAKKQKKAEASVARHKQLELLLQHKVAMQIAWEKDAQRALETSREASQSRITGYGKGKAPEKCVCTNCLRKATKCKWDEGGRGKSEKLFFFLVTCSDQSNRKILPAMSE